MAKKVSGEVVIKVNDAEVKNSLSGIGKEIGRLKKELKELDKTDADYEKNLKRLQGELRTARKRYGEMKDEIYGVKQQTSKLASSIKILGPILAAAFSIQAITQFLQLAKEAVDMAAKARRELASLSGMSGSSLNKNTSEVLAVSATYDLDPSELTKTANAAAKQLEISFEEAFDEIRKGYKDGADLGEDFLKQVKEYAPFMREAKLEMGDLVNIIRLGANEGVYDDKATDAVKEGLLRIREATPGTRAAIAGLGIDVNNLYEKIETGAISYFEAMQLVSQKLEEVGDQSNVTGTAIADIFGGAGEDAGYKYLSQLYKIQDATANNSKELDEYNRQKEKEYQANLELEKTWVALTGAGSAYDLMLIEVRQGLGELLQTMIGIRELRPSDDIMAERVELSMMERELLNVNTNNTRRKEIYEQLQKIYPDIWKGLDLETASNHQLADAIARVSKELQNRYVIQRAGEEIEDAQTDVNKKAFRSEEVKAELDQFISEVLNNDKYKITLPADFHSKDILEQAKVVESQLTNGFWESYFRTSDKSKMRGLISDLAISNSYLSDAERTLQNVSEIQNKIINRAQQARGEMAWNVVAFAKNMMDFAEKAVDAEKKRRLGFKGFADDIKKQQQEADKSRKAADRAWEQEKKRREQIAKELQQIEERFYDNLLSQQRAAQDAKLELQDEGYAKEKESIDLDFNRRIEDLKNQIKEIEKYQQELNDKSKFEYKQGNTTGGDEFKRLAAEQVQIIKEKNATIESIEKLHLLKLTQLKFEYDKKEFEEKQKAYERELMNLETRHNNELKSVETLEEAKKILRNQYGYSEDELSKVRSFEKAKSELTLAQQKETYEKQLQQLTTQQEELKALINEEVIADLFGVGTKTPEELDELILKYEELGNAISKLTKPDGEEKPDENGRVSDQRDALGNIDILGTSADQWEEMFQNLDKLSNKLALAKSIATAMNQIWTQFFDNQNQKIQRDLQTFEASTNRKKTALANQLEQGIISQETYNAKMGKLEADLEKKRAEAEYKQAMNDWKAKMLDANVNTALAVVNALASGSYPANIVFAAIVGALGAVQIGMIAKNKPKKPSGYFSGGYTKGSGNYDEYGRELADGPVHADEYVTPSHLLKDPVIARMTEFIEARRRGLSPNLSRVDDGYADGGFTRAIPSGKNAPAENNSNSSELTAAIRDLTGILEYYQTNPMRSEISKNYQTAQELEKLLEEYLEHKNKNKR